MHHKNFIYGLLLLIILSSCSVSSRIKKADKKFNLGEYYTAGNMYKRIYPSVPQKNKKLRAEVAYKTGNSYRIINQDKKAELAYKNAIRYKYPDSIMYFQYAEILQRNGKYSEALKYYETYLQAKPNNLEAKNGAESCNLILSDWKEKTRYVVKKETEFTSKASEFCPAFASPDGNVLFFNSTRGLTKKNKPSRITGQNNNNIFSARKNVQGKWEEPVILEGDINTEFDEGACSFSADGQELYFSRTKTEKGKKLGTQILMSKRSGGAWTVPQVVAIFKDSTINVSHPALSNDGEYLYFVSDVRGGYGGKDIWRTKKENGTWTYPENLGPTINTAGNEMFPYFRKNGTLYFASDGHPSFGGLDIFSATKNGEKGWTVTNMMAPINSSGDDFGITFSDRKEQGFFSSNREDKKFYDHIWNFSLPELEYKMEGKITDNKEEPLNNASLRIVGDDGSIEKITVKKDGSYSENIKKNTKYVLLASCRGYLNSKNEVSTKGMENNKTFPLDFQLASISRPVKINNIFFKFGSSELTPESSAALDDLVKLLNDNPNITIEIGAHTDMVGTEEANNLLSTQRAQSVVNYLLKAGVEKERLTPRGYGKSTPVTVDKNLARQYKFLKVNTILDEDFINTLKEEEQEIANQINRRTEFKVLKTTYKMY